MNDGGPVCSETMNQNQCRATVPSILIPNRIAFPVPHAITQTKSTYLVKFCNKTTHIISFKYNYYTKLRRTNKNLKLKGLCLVQ